MRIRNLRPGFFKNEDLVQIPFAGRLLFQGLWCLADSEGRLEDRPLRIKGEIFPYETIDVDSLLWQLADLGFIVRYEAAGMKLIWIRNFTKHQAISRKEKAAGSKLPAYVPGVTAVRVGDDAGTIPGPSRDHTGTLDIGHRTQDAGHRTQDGGANEAGASPPALAEPLSLIPPEVDPDRLTPERLVAMWNEATGGKIAKVDPDRRAAIRKAIARQPSPDFWRGCFAKAAAVRATGDAGWLTFDWIFGKSNKGLGWNAERMQGGGFDWKLTQATSPIPMRRLVGGIPPSSPTPPLPPGTQMPVMCDRCGERLPSTWDGDRWLIPDHEWDGAPCVAPDSADGAMETA